MNALPDSLTFDWSASLNDLPGDAMQRAGHARFLTSLLVSRSQSGSFVLNLNAEWGAGKSWFLKRWQAEIADTFPTVYIDAWKNDHLQDPLLNVVAEIRRSLIARTDKAAFDSRLLKGTWRLFKAIAPEVTRALLKSRLGIDSEELGKLLSREESADVGGKLVEAALKAHEEAGDSVEEFRDGISGWLRAVIETSRPALRYPLFIFVDELDRCRPTYAVEMLETIKHLFSIEHVVFVIATDKAQLQHSVRAIYGSGFNSRLYLDRFFHRSVTLNEVSRGRFIGEWYARAPEFSQYCDGEPEAMMLKRDGDRREAINKVLTGIADGFKMHLRTVDLWLDRLAAAVAYTEKKPNIPFLAFLMAIETHAPEKLERLVSGHNVFESAGNSAPLEFSTFPLELYWHYGQCVAALGLGYGQFEGRLNREFCSRISMLHYFTALSSALSLSDQAHRQAAADQLRDSFSEFLKGPDPRRSPRLGDDEENKYHEELTHILSLRHHASRLSLQDYYALCRMAMHLD